MIVATSRRRSSLPDRQSRNGATLSMLGRSNLTEAEVSARIRQIEVECGLLALTLEGLAPWQLVRFEVSIALQHLALSRAPIPRRRIIAGTVRAAYQFFKLSPDSSDYLCKTFDSAYRQRRADSYRDIYFDDLLDGIPGGVKISSCDTPGYEDRVEKAAAPPVFDDTAIIAISALLGRLLPKHRSSHPVFQAISTAVAERLDLPYSPKRIATVFNTFLWRSFFYRKLLARCRPRAVLCADSGQFALMHASAANNIPFYEVQHGVFASVHPNALPASLLDTERRHVLAPTAFAVYGRHSERVLEGTFLHAEGRVRRVGAAFVEGARQKRGVRSPHQKSIIALTTQGVAQTQLLEFLTKFLSLTGDDVELHIRMHPAYNQDESLYRQAFASDRRVTIWSGHSEVTTYDLLAEADFHISVSSTCHYDALGIGVPTGILQLETHESVAELSDVAGAVMIDSPQMLAQMVADRSYPLVPSTTESEFFEAGFLDNIRSLIETGR